MSMFSVHAKQSGVTLIEILVSLVIGVIILAGVVQIYSTSVTSSITYEGAARIQENSLFLFNRLEQDISQAGSNGCFGLVESNERDRMKNVLGYESNDYDLYDLSRYVSGVEDSGVNDSDQLTIRYANKSARIAITSLVDGASEMTLNNLDADYNNLEQYDVVYAANCMRMTAFMITNDPSANGVGLIEFDTGVTAPAGENNENQFNNSDDLGFVVNPTDPNISSLTNSLAYLYGGQNIVEYRVDNSAAGVCSAASPQNCALFRNDVELVDGVEDFEVEYGWENAAGNVVYGDWDVVELAGSSLAVDRIKVTATLNSLQNSSATNGSKTLSRVFMVRNQLPAY